jgi:hypothetical protein
MLAEGRTGEIKSTSGAVNPLVQDITGALVVAQGHGKYFTQALTQDTYFAASQAATTWSVALNTTHTGFVLSNPIGSLVNLVPLQVGFALTVAPVAISHVGLFGGWYAGGISTHTTPLTVYSSYIKGNGGASAAKADAAATLTGTPVWIMPFLGGFTAGALFGTTPSVIDIGGSIVIPPGGYVGIASLTAVIGFAGMIWEEIDIS